MTLGGGCLAAALLAAFLQKGEGSFLPALLLAVSGAVSYTHLTLPTKA